MLKTTLQHQLWRIIMNCQLVYLRVLTCSGAYSNCKYMQIINICYSPAGRSVMGETVPEVLSTALRGTQTEATVSPNTDRPRPVNNNFIFFSYWDLKVSGKFYFSLQPMCVEEGRVRVDVQSARSIANQNKTLRSVHFGVVVVELINWKCRGIVRNQIW